MAAREVSGDKADKWTGNTSLQELLSSSSATVGGIGTVLGNGHLHVSLGFILPDSSHHGSLHLDL